MSARGRLPDSFTRRAQARGDVARSVFKLEEMDRRWRLLRPGQRVLDLGAAPGSWLAYAARRVGRHGSVLGVDLGPLAPTLSLPAWAHFERADAEAWSQGPAQHAGAFDVVLSDMAPATTGHRSTDAGRSAALAELALGIARRHLRASGHVVVKVLEGAQAQGIASVLGREYRRLERLRPEATRRRSCELFLVGLGRRPGARMQATSMAEGGGDAPANCKPSAHA